MKTKPYTGGILIMMKACLAIIVLISCSDERAAKEVKVIADQSTLEFDAEGGVQSFKFQANSDLSLSWTIENVPEWCTLDQTKGFFYDSPREITVEVSPNMDGKEREAVLEITPALNSEYFPPAQVTVKQTFQYATDLSVSSTEIAIPTNDTYLYLSVTADAYWEVTDIPDWIEISPQKGFGDDRLFFENLTDERHAGTFFIASQGKQIEINIEVWGKEEAFIDLHYVNLEDELYRNGLYNVARTLKISGEMNSNDFRALQHLLVLEELDLSDIDFSSKVNSLPPYSLSGCSFRTIILPEKLLSVDSGALSFCPKLQTIDIPEGVVSIADFAFQYCTSLRSVTLPGTLQSINYGAFSDCPDLSEIHIKNPTPFSIPSIVSYLAAETCTLYVPEGSKEKYQQTPGWSAFKNIVEVTNE